MYYRVAFQNDEGFVYIYVCVKDGECAQTKALKKLDDFIYNNKDLSAKPEIYVLVDIVDISD